MGNGASIESYAGFEDALAKAGGGPLDEAAVREPGRPDREREFSAIADDDP